MRINYIVAHPPFREGTGTVAYYNARFLRELGADTLIYAAKHGTFAPGNEPVDFYRFMKSYFTIGNAYLTPALLDMKRADILHLHFPFIFGSELTILKSWIDHVPMVLTYHNDLIGGGIRRPSFWLYNQLITPWILARAKKIVVTSFDYSETSLYANTIFANRKTDLVEVSNGVDADSFHPNVDGEFVRKRHAISSQDFLILFVSSLDKSHARKGLAFLIESLDKIKNSRIKLMVVGDGDMRTEYEQKAKALDLDKQVVFAGRVSQAELAAYYSACDLMCIPSLPPEAFGVALAQGMSAGKPVIGSNIPGVRTLVKNECGFLISPGNQSELIEHINRLADDPALCGRMGQAGRDRIIENFTWQHAAKKLLTMYKQVLRQ